MKKLILFLSFTFLSFTISSQNILIKGRIIEQKDNQKKAFELAVITLFDSDSTYIDGTVSQKDGQFSINKVKNGNYFLTVSFISYKNINIELSNLSKNIDIGDIQIEESSIQLNEITVTGSNVIQKIDRQILLPSDEQLRRSSDPYDLLNRMMINRLNVDFINKSLTVSGGRSVQTRVNGIQATSAEISAIQPNDIVRFEYIEDPISRHSDKDLGAVVNIITKRAISGGQLVLQATNSPFVLYGENFMAFKYNIGKSEWGINYSNRNRGYKKRRRDLIEKYYISNTDPTIRLHEGVNERYKKIDHNINLSYNLYNPEKHTLNIAFRSDISNTPNNNYASKLINTSSIDSYTKTLGKQSSYSPSLDIYYLQQLSNKQTLELNIVGTIINSKNDRNYLEYNDSFADPYLDLTTNVKGKKYSIIAEGIYQKEFENIKLNGGVRHFQMKADNKYFGSNPYKSEMQQSEDYTFVEVQGRIDKFSYGAGLGVTYSWFKEGQNDKGHYTFNPTVKLSYAPHKSSFLRYSFRAKPSIPSLSSLTGVEQELDSIQIMRGNPFLKTFSIYENNLTYSYQNKKFRGNINLGHRYYDKPIMESIFIENNRLVLMDENQKQFQKFNTELVMGLNSIDMFNIPGFFSTNISTGYSHYLSSGLLYKHKYDDFYVNFSVWLSYKEFALYGEYRKFQSSLFSETISKGENTTTFMLAYQKNNLQVALAMIYPFTNNYRYGTERVSKIALVESWTYIKEAGQLALIRIGYSLNFGRKFESAKKNLNNSDNESGILNTNR